MKAKLTISVNDQKTAYALPEAGVKIGRDASQCQLAIPHGDVSSLHAFISCSKDVWTLRDLGSTNGTFVNGEKISSVALNSGDRIKFGTVEAKIELESVSKPVAVEKPAPVAAPKPSAIVVDHAPPVLPVFCGYLLKGFLSGLQCDLGRRCLFGRIDPSLRCCHPCVL